MYGRDFVIFLNFLLTPIYQVMKVSGKRMTRNSAPDTICIIIDVIFS